jgi:hypothetical protein
MSISFGGAGKYPPQSIYICADTLYSDFVQKI